MNLKTISLSTREKLRKIRGGAGLWNRTLEGSLEQIDGLKELALSAEPAVIPEIADYLLSPDPDIRRVTRNVIHQLLAQVPPARLPDLDVRLREIGSRHPDWGNGWDVLEPESVAQVALGEEAVSILGLASFHANGRVREAAIRYLSEYRDGSELPYLLIRVNDWVAPVQELARQAVRARLRSDGAGQFLGNLHLVLRLEFCGRGEHASLVQDVGDMLRRPECRPHLLAGTVSRDRSVRRACLRLAGDIPGEAGLSLLRAASTDSDPTIRFWSARRILAEVNLNDLPALATELAHDPWVPVRREALQAFGQRLPESATLLLMEALLDHHASIREVARFFLGRAPGFDAAAFYRQRMQATTSVQSVGLVKGLGETGSGRDVELIRPLLIAEEPRLRKAAIYGLSLLAPEEFVNEFGAAVGDNHPGVSNEATKALLPRVGLVEPGVLFGYLRDDPRELVRRNSLKLVMGLARWMSLPILLHTSCDGSPLAIQASKFLQTWLQSTTRGYLRPTQSQVADARRALALVSRDLETKLHQDVSTFLDEFRAP